MIYSSSLNIPIGSSTLSLARFSFLTFYHRFANILNSIKLFSCSRENYRFHVQNLSFIIVLLQISVLTLNFSILIIDMLITPPPHTHTLDTLFEQPWETLGSHTTSKQAEPGFEPSLSTWNLGTLLTHDTVCFSHPSPGSHTQSSYSFSFP